VVIWLVWPVRARVAPQLPRCLQVSNRALAPTKGAKASMRRTASCRRAHAARSMARCGVNCRSRKMLIAPSLVQLSCPLHHLCQSLALETHQSSLPSVPIT
jgi:hypothetical protein